MHKNSFTILLFEDNPGDARLVAEYLSESQENTFQIERVNQLGKGLEYLETSDVDLILLDLNLPDSSGPETFTRLYQQAASLPIIVLTGLDDEALATQAVREGAQDYLVKSQLDGNLLARACRYAIERKQADQALWESEERYALSALGANDGLWDLNLLTGETFYSPRWKAILGYEDEEFEDSFEAWLGVIHPDDVEKFKAQFQAHQEKTTSHLECEYRVRYKDGTYRWVLTRGLAVRDKQNAAYRIAGSQTDITDRKQTEEDFRQLAIYDSLTHLPNRSLFIDRLERAIERASGSDAERFAVLYLDIERFRKINERFGRIAGDKILLSIAQRMQETLRSQDTLARLETDDFALLIENVTHQGEVPKLVERILEALNLPFSHNGQDFFIKINIGIVVNNPAADRPEELLRDAEIAMYRAKGSPNESYVFFDTIMHKHDIARYQVEDELQQALERGQLLLHYQPIISIMPRGLVGFEALVRWQHPTRGLVPPDEFIPLAEETGLILPIGNWVLQEACQQLVAWGEQFPTDIPRSMSVNLSSAQLSQRDLVEKTRLLLSELKLDGDQLHLEITEGTVMDPSPAASATLHGFRSLGIHIHLDDFGTGYSSLGYLHQLPIDAIKVDRSFISLDGDGKNSKIVRAIIRLAQELELAAIAEGVETQAQLDQLKQLGCEFAQGYLFSRPLDSERATQLLANEPQGNLFPENRRSSVRVITQKWFGR